MKYFLLLLLCTCKLYLPAQIVRKSLPDNKKLHSLVWNETATQIAATDGKVIHFYSIGATPKLKLVWEKAPEAIIDLLFLKNDHLLFAGENGVLHLLDTKFYEAILQYIGHTDDVVSVATDADNNYLVSASEDGTVRLWEAKTGKQINIFFPHRKGATLVDISANCTYLASIGVEKNLIVRKLPLGEVVYTQIFSERPTALKFSPKGGQLIVGDEKGNLWKLEKFQNGETTNSKLKHTVGKGGVGAIAFSHDQQYLASLHTDGDLLLWAFDKETVILQEEKLKASMTSARFSSNGNWLLTSGEDNLWEISHLNVQPEMNDGN